jgi:hypothetical protein
MFFLAPDVLSNEYARFLFGLQLRLRIFKQHERRKEHRMKNQEYSTILRAALLTLLLSLASGLAFAGTGHQTKTDLAKKEENVRKQQGQRITPDKKKAAAEALKAERLRLYKAKQAVTGSAPTPLETK